MVAIVVVGDSVGKSSTMQNSKASTSTMPSTVGPACTVTEPPLERLTGSSETSSNRVPPEFNDTIVDCGASPAEGLRTSTSTLLAKAGSGRTFI